MISIEEIKEMHKAKTLDLLFENNAIRKQELRGEVNRLSQIIGVQIDMEAVYLVLIGLYILAFIVASQFPMKEDGVKEAEDYSYVKPKVIPNQYTDNDIQEKKRIFEECLRKGMTPFEALKEII